MGASRLLASRWRSVTFAVWRFEGGKVPEITTIQDQFALLKRIGYLPEEVYAV
jgi:hypothetical protein